MNHIAGRVDSDVTGDEDVFQIIEHIVVDLRFSGDNVGYFAENAGFGVLKAIVERFFLFFFGE